MRRDERRALRRPVAVLITAVAMVSSSNPLSAGVGAPGEHGRNGSAGLLFGADLMGYNAHVAKLRMQMAFRDCGRTGRR